MKPIFVWRHVAAVVALLGASPLWASNLLADYQRARQYDAAFSASLTEYETQRLQASVAATAYMPPLHAAKQTHLANHYLLTCLPMHMENNPLADNLGAPIYLNA